MQVRWNHFGSHTISLYRCFNFFNLLFLAFGNPRTPVLSNFRLHITRTQRRLFLISQQYRIAHNYDLTHLVKLPLSVFRLQTPNLLKFTTFQSFSVHLRTSFRTSSILLPQPKRCETDGRSAAKHLAVQWIPIELAKWQGNVYTSWTASRKLHYWYVISNVFCIRWFYYPSSSSS